MKYMASSFKFEIKTFMNTITVLLILVDYFVDNSLPKFLKINLSAMKPNTAMNNKIPTEKESIGNKEIFDK